MIWYSEFNAVFFISIGTILISFFGLIIKYCLKSKCENISVCCGLLNIKRRVDLEVQEEMARMEMGNTSDDDDDKKEKKNKRPSIIKDEPKDDNNNI